MLTDIQSGYPYRNLNHTIPLSIRAVGGSIGRNTYYDFFYNPIAKLPIYVAEYAINAGLSPTSAKELVTLLLTGLAKRATVPGFTRAILEGAVFGSR
jgi:hypothetical protein